MKKQWTSTTARIRTLIQNPWPFAALTGVALVYIGTLVSGLAEDVLEQENIVLADGRLVYWLAVRRTSAGIRFFEGISLAGNWEVAIGLLAIMAVIFWKRHLRAVLTMLLACAGSEAAVYFGKLTLNRPRPPAVLAVVHELDASFPSGHANISVSCYALGFYLLARYTRSRRLRKLWYGLAAAVPLLIGFSRLYLGAHYLSDVLAGWCIGLWWSILAMGIAGFRRRRAVQRHGEQ